jgi:hypothetical protein
MYFYTGSESTGITSEQVTAIEITLKSSNHTEQAAIVDNISGSNTGDQDLSSLAGSSSVNSGLATKVDKVAGMGLSSEDYGTMKKTNLDQLLEVIQAIMPLIRNTVIKQLITSLQDQISALVKVLLLL